MSMEADDSQELIPIANEAVGSFSVGLTRYLDGLGLPSQDVLADESERRKALGIAPSLVALLDDGHLADAMYVSKFVAACGAGLFDAALNFIWDEVVLRLRQRVARFDLGYFYDTAVRNAETRKQFQTESDLTSLSDADLLLGALKCGMLSDIGYKHLDYIREMRNWASAAHPNSAQLTGLQLVTWLETCVKEVILKEPEGAVLEVGRLLSNLRGQVLGVDHVPAIIKSVRRLPIELVAALLRSSFGLYCDPRQEVRIRSNVQLIAPGLWRHSPDGAKGEVGLKYASYSANADIERKEKAHEFLELVDGLTCLPEGDLALEMSQRIQRLESVHDAMNNFHNEPSAARDLRRYVHADGRIPSQVDEEYVRVLLRCRIGRTSGVSNAAVPVYDEMFALFQEPQMKLVLQTFSLPEITSCLAAASCAARFKEIVGSLRARAVDRPLQSALDFVIAATDAQVPSIGKDTRFRKLLEQL